MQLRPAAFTLLACGLAAAVWAAFAAAAPAARIRPTNPFRCKRKQRCPRRHR